MRSPNWRFKTEKVSALVKQIKAVSAPVARASAAMIYLPRGWPENAAEIFWAARDAHGQLQQGRVARLEELPANVRGARLVVWTPGAESLLTQVSLPTRARAKILQALPYALEDQVLGEPETMSYAFRPLADGKLAVAVTAKDRIDAWREALTLAGLRPACVAPITLGIPYTSPDWSAAFIDSGLAVRTGSDAGFDTALAGDAVPPILVAALREARAGEQAPAQLRVFNAPRDWQPDAWAEALGLPVVRDDEPLWLRLEPPAGISLLQTGVSGGGQLHPVVHKLRPAAIMFAVWIVAGFLFNAWEWVQLSRTGKQQRDEMTALFRRTFPDAKTVVDPALQMQRSLNDLQARGGAGNPGDLLPLLGELVPALQGNPNIQLQGLQYAENGATLEIHAPDFQALEAIKNQLAGKGLQVDILTSNSRGNAVDGKLRVSAGKRA